MGSPFGDPPILHQQDQIRVPDCGKPVGDDEGGPAFRDGEHGLAYPLFRYSIHRTGGFIQNQDGGILENRPGDCQKLPFPPGSGRNRPG